MRALGGWLPGLPSDVRAAVRSLARAPTFSAVAVLTLGLAIGATTAVYSIVDAVLLEPLPLPGSDRLVSGGGRDERGQKSFLSYPDFEDLRAQARSFEAYSAFVPQSVNLTGIDQPQQLRGGYVSDDFFVVAGVEPALGRGFRQGIDDREGAERVCVLQHETWQRLFGGDPAAIGRVVQLNNEPFTVLGILPAGFRFPLDEVEVWIPHHHWPVHRRFVADGRIASRAAGLVGGIGRLRTGASVEQAQTELSELFARLTQQHPEGGVRSAAITPLRQVVVGDVRQPLLVLFGAVAFVLVIACFNVAVLLLVRAARRRTELATRIALGASRRRIFGQLLTESALLWAVSGALGLALGVWFLELLLAMAPGDLPGGLVARVDSGALGFVLLLTAVTAAAFGSIPALRASAGDAATALGASSRTSTDGSGSHRLRSVLVAAQVALALVLLLGSGLLMRSFQRLTRVDAGFRAEGVLSLEYRLPRNKYGEPAAQWDVHRRILEQVRQVPGARSAALVSGLPFSGNGGTIGFRVAGAPASGDAPLARATTVSDGYFETLAIALLRGRLLTAADDAGSAPVVVVSKSLADRYFQDADPVGHRLSIEDGGSSFEVEIVGVVADTKHQGLDEDTTPTIFGAQAQNPGIFNTLVVRADRDPMLLAEAVRAAVWAVDPDQPVWKVRTLASLVERSVGLPRFLARTMASYAGVALLLAAIGVYGVVATLVTQRRRELGLRLALGAQPRDVLRLVLVHGLRWTSLGVLGGAVGALALGRVLRSLLYRTEVTDPLTLAAVATILALVALVASYLPARAAAAIDPARTLHTD